MWTYQKSVFLEQGPNLQTGCPTTKVDCPSVALERQKETFCSITGRALFSGTIHCQQGMKAPASSGSSTGLLKNLNYTARNAPEYAAYLAQIDELVKTASVAPKRELN